MEEDQPWAGPASPCGQVPRPGAMCPAWPPVSTTSLLLAVCALIEGRGDCCGYSLVFGGPWASRLRRTAVLPMVIFLCLECTRLYSMPMAPRIHSSSWSHGLWADRFQSVLDMLLTKVRLWDFWCCGSLCRQLWSCSTCLRARGGVRVAPQHYPSLAH